MRSLSLRVLPAALVMSVALACGGADVPVQEAAPEGLPAAPDAPARALIDGTLCLDGEKSLLTCGTPTGLLSLCASDEVLRARYGKPGSVDVEYPVNDQPVQDAFQWSSTQTQGSMGGPPGGQTSTLSFTHGGSTYQIDEQNVSDPFVTLVVKPASGSPTTSPCDQHLQGSLSFVARRMSLPVDEAL